MAWKLSYIDFKSTILSAAVTPGSFLVPYFAHKIIPISLSLLWKLTDLFFAGLSASFLTFVYWQSNKPKTLFEKLSPLIILLSSVGYIYSFTSMSGEGIPLFFALLGVHSVSRKNYFLGFIFLTVCMLSKFTFYLIMPGITIWGLINLKNFSRREIKQVIIFSTLFLIIFFTYHSLKNWADIKLQFTYINSVIPTNVFQNFPYYFLALLLGAPLITIFAILNPAFKNIFYLAAFSAFLMLLRRYFYWNHPQQIIMFFALYFFSNEKAKMLITKRNILIHVAIFVSIIAIMPIYSKTIPIFFKHQLVNESWKIEAEILKDYHGGKVGYYLNRSYEEPFPTYEISYMPDNQYGDLFESEYVVIPTVIGIQDRLRKYPMCNFIYYKQTESNVIYKVTCQRP